MRNETMPVRDNRPGPVRGVTFLLFCVASGVVLGLGWAIAQVLQHDYLSLGFWRNIFSIVSGETIRAAVGGAVAGVVVLLVRPLWIRIRPLQGNSLLPSLICLACGLLVLAARFIIFGGVHPTTAIGLILATFFWCIAFALFRRRIFRTALVVLFVLFIAGGIFLRSWQHLLHYLDIEVLAPCLAACSLVLVGIVCGKGPSPRRSVPGVCVLLVLLPVILWPLAPWVRRPGPGQEKPWNIILIGIDTLRWDHTSLAGAGKAGLTPNLSSLAARGTVFQSAISQAPWTMPAFASILTGKYPHEHGAYLLSGFLRKREVTLAEVLREAGYTTGAVVSHLYVDAEHGFSQGFDSFNEDNILGYRGMSDEGVTDRAVEFLDRNADGRFFLFMHCFDPHWVYQDHEDWSSGNAYKGWLGREPLEFSTLVGKRHLLGTAEVDYLKGLYDEEIAHTDRQIGRILAFLKERGLEKNTAVVVVADHGEEFLDHGCFGHSVTLYDEVMKVPLVVVLPGFDHGRKEVPETVETRAVFSTILEHVGVPWGGAGRPRSLLPMMKEGGGEVPGKHNRAYSSVWLSDEPAGSLLREQLSSLRGDRWKLIIDHKRKKEYLFDLAGDPGERKNLATKEQAKLKEMRIRLMSWWKRMERSSDDTPYLRPGRRKRSWLRSLGYL